MPAALYFTESDEANRLIATEPLALLIGFALDQQVTVPTAFAGPLKLTERIGALDATTIAAMDPAELEMVFRERPAIHRFPGSMARRVQELCAVVADEYGGNAERVWTEATDGSRPAEADRRAARLRRDEDHGARLRARAPVRRRGRAGARPEHPCLGKIDSPEALAEYQAAKRAHKAALRAAAGPA